jgi:hypothetical protein
MLKFTAFEELDNEAFFVQFVREQYEEGWGRLAQVSHSKIVTDPDLIKLAHDQYVLNLKQYTVALRSKNPDQYKRAGALLHSLYVNSVTSPIASIEWGPEVDRLTDHDAVGVSHGDAEYWTKFVNYYEEYANRMLAFDLAFRCCDIYEPATLKYNKDYLDNMAYYMAENSEISAASFVMIFKSFWFRANGG